MAKLELILSAEVDGLRLDQCLARVVPELSRRTARIALDVGCVFLNKRRVKVASRAVKSGQRLLVHLGSPFQHALINEQVGLADEPEVLFEDSHLVAAYKPPLVHTVPTTEGDVGTLAFALEKRKGGSRVFVVHRLDLPTSGVLVFAKTGKANARLAELFQQHSLERVYDAFMTGTWEQDQTVTARVGGKVAKSHFRLLEQRGASCHVEARLETGRTHQIRLHGRRIGHTVLGDERYGTPTPLAPPRLALHARALRFAHPFTGEELRLERALPPDLAHWWENLPHAS